MVTNEEPKKFAEILEEIQLLIKEFEKLFPKELLVGLPSMRDI